MSDYLGAPRFKMTELEGFNARNRVVTSFTIVDRAYCCCEVWSDYARQSNGPLWIRRFQANQRCAELNAKCAQPFSPL